MHLEGDGWGSGRAIQTENTKDENEIVIRPYRAPHCGCMDSAIESPWLKMPKTGVWVLKFVV